MAEAGLLVHKRELNAAEIQENLQTVLGAEADTSAAMSSLGLSAAIEGQTNQTVKLSAAKLKEAVDTGVLTEAQAQELAMRTGVMLSMKTQAATTLPMWIATLKAATLAIWDQIKATAVWLATTPVGWITLAIGAIVGATFAIKKYNDSIEEAKKKSKERTDELLNDFKEMNNTLENHKKTVSELADRYDELSKGVNRSTNKNKSLSTDEYEEFLNINKQLADSFPSLSQGIDENGNSILSLGTKGLTAKEQLEELLQTEEGLNNFKISQDLDKAFEGVYTYVEEADEATGKLDGYIKNYNKDITRLQELTEKGIHLSSEDNQLIFEGVTDNYVNTEYYNSFQKSIDEFLESLDVERRSELGNLLQQEFDSNTNSRKIFLNTAKLTEDELTELEDIINTKVDNLFAFLQDDVAEQSQELQNRVQLAEGIWQDFLPNVIAGMKSKQTFKNLDDPDLQNIAVQIVEGLDYNFANAIHESGLSVYDYIRENIITPMNQLTGPDKQKLKTNFNDLFKLDPEDYSQSNQEQIKQFIADIAGLLKKNPIELRAILGFDIGDDTQKRLENSLYDIVNANNSKNTGSNFFPNLYGKLNPNSFNLFGTDKESMESEDLSILTEYTDKLTLSEKELWLESTKGAKSATEAIAMFEAAKAKLQADENPVLSFIESLSQIQSLSKGLDQLGKIYADILDKENFDWNSIINDDFKNTFGIDGLTEEYDSFIKTIAHNKDDIDACQDSFNRLATAYINSSDAMEGLSKETENATIEMLNQMGVENAKEFVEARLAAQEAFLTEKKRSVAITSADLESATWDEITAIVLEGDVSEKTKLYLENLALAKFNLSDNPINTDTDVNAIIAIANASGASVEYVTTLQEALDRLQKFQSIPLSAWSSMDDYYADREELEGDVDNLFKELKEHINENQIKPSDFYADIRDGSNTKNTRDNTTKDAEKEFKETYNWIETAITRIERLISRLKSKSESVYKTWTNRNNNLRQEISAVRNEIGLQQSAYDKYMQQANSVGLSADWAARVQNGNVDIETVTDEGLSEKIKEYQEWYEKALACQDAIDSLNETISDLYKTHFDNIAAQYDNLLGDIESRKNLLDASISHTEEKGWLVGAEYYKKLMDVERENIAQMENKRNSLLNAISNAFPSEVALLSI